MVLTPVASPTLCFWSLCQQRRNQLEARFKEVAAPKSKGSVTPGAGRGRHQRTPRVAMSLEYWLIADLQSTISTGECSSLCSRSGNTRLAYLAMPQVTHHEFCERGRGEVHACQIVSAQATALSEPLRGWAVLAQRHLERGEPGWGVLDTSSGVPRAPFRASVLFPEAAANQVTPSDSCLAQKIKVWLRPVSR
jgi:hypothetical protein